MVLQGSMISFGEEGSVIRSPGAGGVGWGGGRRKEGRETYTYSLFGFYIRPGRLEDSLAIDRFYRLRVFAEQRPAPGDFSIFSGNNPLRHTGWLLTFTLHPDSDCYIFTDGLYIHRAARVVSSLCANVHNNARQRFLSLFFIAPMKERGDKTVRAARGCCYP